MNYKAIIFDMDGTIISSETLWAEATHYLLKEKGNITTEECKEILQKLKGISLYTTCAYIKETYQTKESVEELMEAKEKFVFEKFSELVTFIEGFEQFHKKLSVHGMKSAIATNANLSSLEKILQHIPLKNFFDKHIYCIDHVNKKPKPLPDVFLHAAQQLDIDPKLCIAIEDSAHGITAAKAAGMFCIGINTGKDEHAIKQADIIIQHYDEIDLQQLL